MKILIPSLFTKKEEPIPEPEKRALFTSGTSLSYGTLSTTMDYMKSMQLSTVYRCVEVISSAIASLPFEPIKRNTDGSKNVDYSHISYDILNVQPNRIQSRFTFIKTLITHVLLHGNGFAYIERDGNGNAISLILLPANEVSVFITADRKEVYYKHSWISGDIPAYNMIHVLGMSYDGIRGVSVLTHANISTSTALASELHAKGFFSGGANVSGILTVEGGLGDGEAEVVQQKWRSTLNPETGNPNGVVVLEGDMKFSPISINPADAQMLESRQFSVIEIARFFGVSPTKLFDTSASTYNNIEQSNLSFLTDTLTPLLENVENEFNRKLFRPSERKLYSARFDVTSLLRGDLAAQADYYSKMFQVGAFTINDIRRKIDNPVFEHEKANTPFVQSSMLDITQKIEPVNKQDNQSKQPENNITNE